MALRGSGGLETERAGSSLLPCRDDENSCRASLPSEFMCENLQLSPRQHLFVAVQSSHVRTLECSEWTLLQVLPRLQALKFRNSRQTGR